MAAKPRNRASLDADAVARMMREQDEPETAAAEIPPAPEPAPAPASTPLAQTVPTMLGPRGAPSFDPGKVDGRTLRRTGREPFATRLKPEAHEIFRRVAYADGITISEAVEEAARLLQASKNQGS